MKRERLILTLAIVLVAAVTWYGLNRPTRPEKPVQGQKPAETLTTQPSPQPATKSQPRLATRPLPKREVLADTNALTRVASAIRAVVDAQADYVERRAAIQSMTNNLTGVEVQTLYAFLLRRGPFDHDQFRQAIKNQLLDQLCELDPPPDGLGNVLVQIYRDRSQHEVLRDYAVQHLAAFYEQMELAEEGVRQVRRAEWSQIPDVLWEAVQETDTSIGGTALIGLTRLLSERRPEFDGNRVADTALRLARDQVGGELTHITAIQVCSRLGIKEALPVVLRAAESGETLPVRIAAVGALGVLGGPDVRPFLTSLLNGTEERLKLPARHALNQIQQQEQPNDSVKGRS